MLFMLSKCVMFVIFLLSLILIYLFSSYYVDINTSELKKERTIIEKNMKRSKNRI
jgi:predicted membrane channel-forming protein YqfA (hemolysin III family)